MMEIVFLIMLVVVVAAAAVMMCCVSFVIMNWGGGKNTHSVLDFCRHFRYASQGQIVQSDGI